MLFYCDIRFVWLCYAHFFFVFVFVFCLFVCFMIVFETFLNLVIRFFKYIFVLVKCFYYSSWKGSYNMNTAILSFYSYEHKHIIFGLLHFMCSAFFPMCIFLPFWFSFLSFFSPIFSWYLVLCIYKTNLGDNWCLNLSNTGRICFNGSLLTVRWDKFNSKFAEYHWHVYQT